MLKRIINHPARAHILMVFGIIVLNKLGFDLRGGEEQYLAFAKQAWNPDWIPGSFTYSEFPGSRIVFQSLVGPAMQALSFEVATFFFRLLNFALIAVPIGLILERLNVNLLSAFLSLQLFLMSSQNLVGGEWIIRSFEPKSIAYVFVFFGLYEMLRSKYLRVAIHMALATYFHVLVGGWIMLLFGLIILIKGQWKGGFLSGGLYTLLMVPFIWYLYQGYLSGAIEPEYNLNHIYCDYRLPHHLGIWKTTEYFLNKNASAAFLMLLVSVSAFWWLPRLDKEKKVLGQLIVSAFVLNLIFVGVAAMDHFYFENSGSFGLKYYPFRSNSIGQISVYFLLIPFIVSWVLHRFKSVWIERLWFLLAVGLLISQTVNIVGRNIDYLNRDSDFTELTEFVRTNTPKTATFLMLERNHHLDDYISFGRRAERENFVVSKFVSAEPTKLAEWYRRERVYRNLDKNPGRILDSSKQNGFDYVISQREISELDKVHSSGAFNLYVVPGVPRD